MSTVILVLLGLCAIIVQSSVVIVARHFLDVHHERPLSTIGRMVMVTGVILPDYPFCRPCLLSQRYRGCWRWFSSPF